MELEKCLNFKIRENSYNFRTIHGSDVNQEYVDGLKKQARYIENIPVSVSLNSQKQYVNKVLMSTNDTICGLFKNDNLIGTAGIQLSLSDTFKRNINVTAKDIATIGIFIFNKNDRCSGLGKSMIWAATYLFHKCTETKWFGAGMEKVNIPSYKAFLSCGYQHVYSDEKNHKVLVHISDLVKPEMIRKD